MLTKLIKYEFRASSRLMPFVYLAAVLLSAVGALTALSNSFLPQMIAYTLLYFAGSAALIITYIVIFIRFYKGMYGAEGYLAHTLPVDVKTLYRSKTVVSLIWLAISTVVTLVTWGVAWFLFIRAINMTTDDPWPVGTTELFSSIFSSPIIVWIAVSTVISWLAFLAIVFFCTTLSAVKPFSKLGIGSSVLAYIALAIVEQIVTILLLAVVPLSMKFSPETLSWSFTTQTMLGWFIETMQWNEETTGGFVISLAINVPQILFAFILPIVTKRLIERKMIVK